MRRDELTELHYIAPIANLPSIFARGLLSHNGMKRIAHESVAMRDVQDIRTRLTVPGGMRLHDYVNLYICARNPMMYLRRAQHNDLCVLSVSAGILDIPGTVVTDHNAASSYRRFAAAPDGLNIVDRGQTFARYWTHPGDPAEELRHKARKCAEVLVPHRVPPESIEGVYVSGTAGQVAVGRCCNRNITVDADLFFR